MNKKVLVSLMVMVFALSAVSFADPAGVSQNIRAKEKTQIRMQKKEAVKNAVQQKQQIKTQAREQLKDGSGTGDGTKAQKRNMFGFKVGRGSGSGRGK